MRFAELQGLTEEGIGRYMEYLDKELARSTHYKHFSTLPEGKFLIDEMRTRRELARNLYTCIDPQKDGAIHLLTLLQAYEREADEWLGRLVGEKDRSTELENQKKAIMSLVEERKKRSEHRMFLPQGYEKEK